MSLNEGNNRFHMTAKQTRQKKDKTKGSKEPEGEAAPPNPPEKKDAGSKSGAEDSAAAEREALNDRLLRLQADFENYRKRTLREREAERLRANEDLMQELLPVLDHLELGLKTAEKHKVESSVIQGFEMVLDQALGVLRRFGLEPMDAEGELFDPHAHESVALAPSDTTPRDMVLTQVRRGYRLGSQLLRPAQVVVSKGPATQEGVPEDDEMTRAEPESVE